MHPSSRKAFQLTRVVMRNDRLEQRARSKETVGNPKIDRYLWFKFALDDTLPCATTEELHSLIQMYLCRHDEELENLQALRKGNRPKTGRQDILEALIKKEKDEYEKGFGKTANYLDIMTHIAAFADTTISSCLELPDLQNPKNVKILRSWDGDKNSMARIKTKTVVNPDANAPSKSVNSNAMDVAK
ncbi:hypothetical protein INT43_001147 [Umbelopsis isabellina]|uniref:Uncharacterized protein n=1 Tax=Mortierella isabellina TaxID=91625 RepID=A0A8H7PKR5_MORIS|nr:hypothetical protein INT43_001147 [Umbelopsis isabellina]